MENKLQATNMLRKAAIITLVGFLAIALAGPIVALLGTMLPFALVGLAVYVPYRLVILAKQGGWPAVSRAAGKTVRMAFAPPRWVLGKVAGVFVGTIRLVRGALGFVSGVVFPPLGGAIAGAVLGAVGGMEHGDAEMRAPVGALIGASIGLVAVLWRPDTTRSIPMVLPVTPQNVQHA